MPPSFLEELAAKLYKEHYPHLDRLTVVLPTWRAGAVLRQCIAAHLQKPIWAPQVLGIEDWLQALSPLRQEPSLRLVRQLYPIFQALRPHQEPFERFYQWGSLLLQDFEVIDKYLVEATHLFTDLSHQKALSLSYDYLTEAQKAAILSFWQCFEERLSSHQQDFLQLWKLLPQVYTRFVTQLKAQGIGYQGLCQRAAYEALVQGACQLPHQHLVFAGFNALTPVEEKTMAWCKAHVPTDFYWDTDAYYMEDVQQEAGMYLRAYQQRPHFRASLAQPFPKRLADPAKKIHLTAVASEVGQAQVVGAQLNALMEQQKQFVPSKTAIVLANEALLLPVLQALPLPQNQISVTLGYPLKDTVSYSLLEHLIALQVALAQGQCPVGYLPVAEVLALLHHPHVLSLAPDAAQTLLQRLQTTAGSHVPQADLVQQHPAWKVLFSTVAPQEGLLPYLTAVLQCIRDSAQPTPSPMHALEAQALEQLLQQLDRLQEVLPQPTASFEDLAQLLRQLLQPIQLSPNRYTAEGIQILGVLETVNLDFEHVFIVGMNEGQWPAQAGASSFIPYHLRQGYGLPIAESHQAALYAYHFYRLLQRAQQVYVTYSTATATGSPGEMSRYLWQLLYESDLPIQRQVAVPPLHMASPQPIVVPKQGPILDQLAQWTVRPQGPVQALTPSALNTYLDCSLRFYFQYIAQLKPPAEPVREVTPLLFGQLLHTVMEQLYAPLVASHQEQPIQPDMLAALQTSVTPTIQKAFARALHPGAGHATALSGPSAIAQAVMTKLVQRLLALDQAYAPFTLVGLEMGRSAPLYLDLALSPTTRVRLRGIIDRVDYKEGAFRVLDYKTGADNPRVKHIEALFDPTDTRRNKAALQTLVYAWLFQENYATAAKNVMPGLISTRQVFDEAFDPRFLLQQPYGSGSLPIDDFQPHRAALEAGLRQTISELLDPKVPFQQTTDMTRCTACPYRSICQRH